MRKSSRALLLAVLAIAALAIWSPSSTEEKSPAENPAPSQEELEKKFKEMLTQSTLTGRWRLVQDGKLGEEKEEKYTITSVTKAGNDLWIILARVQYGGKDVTLPVPVTVKWAGDTPIIAVTKAGLPGLGTYTARVMFYENIYTGAWFGSDHGGTLTGTIVKETAKKDEEAKPKGESKKEE